MLEENHPRRGPVPKLLSSMPLAWFDQRGAKIIASALTASLLVGVAAGAYWGNSELATKAGQLRGTPPVVAIEWPRFADGADAGTWLPPSQQLLLSRLATDAISDDPLDAGSLPRAALALEASGWLRAVTSIKRHPGGTVTVRGRWRTYYAAVRVINTDHLVSAQGELLPLKYAPGKTGLPVIFSASQNPPLKPGAAWEGGDVQAGIRLIAVLAGHAPIMEQVVGVDVGRYTRDRTLSIVTSSGAHVVWGTAPGDFAPAEASQEQKLRRLLDLRQSAEHRKRIDAGHTKIDISSPRGIMIDQSSSFAGTPVGDLGPASKDEPRVDDQRAGGGIGAGQGPAVVAHVAPRID